MKITESQTADLLHLLRHGASMAREMTAMHKFDARFGERLALDYIEAADGLVVGMRHHGKDGGGEGQTTLLDCLDLAISIVEEERRT